MLMLGMLVVGGGLRAIGISDKEIAEPKGFHKRQDAKLRMISIHKNVERSLVKVGLIFMFKYLYIVQAFLAPVKTLLTHKDILFRHILTGEAPSWWL